MSFRPFLLSVICVLGAVSTSRADLLTFDVVVDQPSYNIGDTVNWQLSVTVSDVSDNNWGIDTASANLKDSFEETLLPGTVGAAGNPFRFYSLRYGGVFSTTTKELIEIGATLNQQNELVEANLNDIPPDSLGPLLLASGSYMPTIPGLHTLTATAGSTNRYFDGPDDLSANTNPTFTTAFVDATFEVVPEPSTMSLGILSAVFSAFAIWWKRRRTAVPA